MYYLRILVYGERLVFTPCCDWGYLYLQFPTSKERELYIKEKCRGNDVLRLDYLPEGEVVGKVRWRFF